MVLSYLNRKICSTENRDLRYPQKEIKRNALPENSILQGFLLSFFDILDIFKYGYDDNRFIFWNREKREDRLLKPKKNFGYATQTEEIPSQEDEWGMY